MQICAETIIRLFFEIIRFCMYNLILVILLFLLTRLGKLSNIILGFFVVLTQMGDILSAIPYIGWFFAIIAGSAAFAAAGVSYGLMVLNAPVKPILKYLSIIPIALIGAIIETILPIPGASVVISILLISPVASTIICSLFSAATIYILIIGNEFICTTINTTLKALEGVRNYGFFAGIKSAFATLVLLKNPKTKP